MNITNEASGWISLTQLTQEELKQVSTRMVGPEEEPLKVPTPEDIHNIKEEAKEWGKLLKDKQNGQSLTEQYAESMLGRSVLPATDACDEAIVDALVAKTTASKDPVKLIPGGASTASSPKTRDSSHKVPVNLCPASAIIAIALVIAQGHRKPGRTIYNWRTQPISYMDYLGATHRHLLKSQDGSDYDEELSQLASDDRKNDQGEWVVQIRHDWAAMSCLAIIEDARQAGTLVDDRPVKGGAEKFLDILQSAREKK